MRTKTLQAAFRLAVGWRRRYRLPMGEQDTARTSGKDRARSERLAKALRENLKRRKAQSRHRDEEAGTPAPGTRVPFDEDSKQP
jgi:hypothetical protein